MLRSLILLFIIVFTTYSSCHKGVGCNQLTYSFSTYFKAYPDADSVDINDTIWLEFSCPVVLNDVNSGASINFSGASNLGTSIDYVKLIGGSVSNPGVIPAANSFDYKLAIGAFIPDPLQPEKNRDYAFTQVGGEYKFKLGIIPKQPGIFALAVSDAPGIYRSNDHCVKAGFSITFANTNQHTYFYEQNRPGYTPSQYERTHTYCFKVK